MSKAFGFTSLTGGGTGALDAIDGALLSDGDLAFGADSSYGYTFRLSASSGAAESSPGIIAPDSNAGTKRWIRSVFDPLYINVAQTGAGASSRTLASKIRDVISVEDFGAVGDGTTDDYTAIASAIAQAVASGKKLYFDGTKTYAMESALSISSSVKIVTNGAIFKDTIGTTLNTPFITISADNIVIDQIRIMIGDTKRRDRAILFSSCTNITVGDIEVLAEATTVQECSETDDAGIKIITCTEGRFGRLITDYYDRGVIIGGCENINIQGLKISRYVRGLYAYDNLNLFIGPSRIATASVNASFSAGHNGVLLQCTVDDAQRDLTLSDFIIKDSGEHAIRIAGDKRQSNIFITRVRILNCGGVGIKILGTDVHAPTDRNANIVIDNPIIEDAGTNGSGERFGIGAEFVDYLTIINPIIRPFIETYSATHGIFLDGVTNVTITNPFIQKCSDSGVYIYAEHASNERVNVIGGIAFDCANNGLYIRTAATFFNRRIHCSMALDANDNFGFEVTNAGTMVDSLLTLKCYGNTNGVGACDTTACSLEGQGDVGSTPLAGITANDGSTWKSGTTMHIRKAGTWTAF